MKTTITLSQFRDGFSHRKDNFSYEGLEALYNWLEDIEEAGCQDMEFDPIALCCEFSEYKDLEELQKNYTDIESMEDLERSTIVISIPGEESFIIQDY